MDGRCQEGCFFAIQAKNLVTTTERTRYPLSKNVCQGRTKAASSSLLLPGEEPCPTRDPVQLRTWRPLGPHT